MTYGAIEYVANTQQEIGFDIVLGDFFCARDQRNLSLSDDFSGLEYDCTQG